MSPGSISRSRNRVERPRYHQPTGYRSTFGGESRRYYGRRHDYIFFPVAWTDAETGTSYESGYYDENGVRYDSIAVEQNGRYENVVCQCPYCGHKGILTLSASETGEQSLGCPECGGTMDILSALDDYLDDGGAGDISRGVEAEQPRRSSLPTIIFTVFFVAAVVFIASIAISIMRPGNMGGDVTYEPEMNPDDTLWLDGDYDGDTIYLVQTGENAYAISTDGSADKTLVWDADADSYVDEDEECWVWYNKDVEPAVWQYWYEGISSDYGDYGWMEHYDDGWFIEEDEGHWIPLPEVYDDGRLWYIEG